MRISRDSGYVSLHVYSIPAIGLKMSINTGCLYICTFIRMHACTYVCMRGNKYIHEALQIC